MIVVAELQQTCASNPSQWEGYDSEGNQIYARYRWGHLTVEVNGTEVFARQLGDHLDGRLTFEGLKEATKDFITWDSEKAI
jgi:hypothetical protein